MNEDAANAPAWSESAHARLSSVRPFCRAAATAAVVARGRIVRRNNLFVRERKARETRSGNAMFSFVNANRVLPGHRYW